MKYQTSERGRKRDGERRTYMEQLTGKHESPDPLEFLPGVKYQTGGTDVNLQNSQEAPCRCKDRYVYLILFTRPRTDKPAPGHGHAMPCLIAVPCFLFVYRSMNRSCFEPLILRVIPCFFLPPRCRRKDCIVTKVSVVVGQMSPVLHK